MNTRLFVLLNLIKDFQCVNVKSLVLRNIIILLVQLALFSGLDELLGVK